MLRCPLIVAVTQVADPVVAAIPEAVVMVADPVDGKRFEICNL